MRDLRTDRRFSAVALLLKDALRGARFALRRGRDLIEPPAPARALAPPPVDEAARGVLAGVDRIALGLDDLGSKLGHALLDLDAVTNGPAPILTRLRARPAADLAFAELAYRGAARVLKRFGASYAFISEASAAECFRKAGRGSEAPSRQAARLYRALRAGGFVRDVVGRADAEGEAASDGAEALTVFAVLLWMLAEPGAEPDRGDAVLLDCADLASALFESLQAAEADAAALEALFADYSGKV